MKPPFKSTFFRLPAATDLAHDPNYVDPVTSCICSESKDFTPEMLVEFWKTFPWPAKERIFVRMFLLVPPTLPSYYWWISTRLTWILRRVFIETNPNTSEGELRLKRAFEALAAIRDIGQGGNVQLERKFFNEIGVNASIRSEVGTDFGKRDHQ